jgi:thiazolinyl imide reductase
MPEPPIRVLVCGSNYARFYLQSIERSNGVYSLAAILARGSKRSRELADRSGVSLVAHPDEVPGGFDVACVALPIEAGATTLDLLDRGHPVLCEHPQPPDFLDVAIQRAEQASVPFHLNAHFPDLAAPEAFVHGCQQRPALRFLHVHTADRALYAVLDMLQRATGVLNDLEVEQVCSGSPFHTVRARCGEVSLTMEIQLSGREDGTLVADGSPEYLATFRIAAGFDEGVLSLLAMAGPVIWNTNEGKLREADARPFETVFLEPARLKHFALERTMANLRAMEALCVCSGGGPTPPHQSRSHMLAVSRAWKTLGDCLGI